MPAKAVESKRLKVEKMYKSQEQSDKVGKVGFDSQLGGTLISQGHLSIHYYLIKKDPIVFFCHICGGKLSD